MQSLKLNTAGAQQGDNIFATALNSARDVFSKVSSGFGGGSAEEMAAQLEAQQQEPMQQRGRPSVGPAGSETAETSASPETASVATPHLEDERPATASVASAMTAPRATDSAPAPAEETVQVM